MHDDVIHCEPRCVRAYNYLQGYLTKDVGYVVVQVQDALRKLHSPEVQERMKKEEEARHIATGGRW
jgi:hypothetical protein